MVRGSERWDKTAVSVPEWKQRNQNVELARGRKPQGCYPAHDLSVYLQGIMNIMYQVSGWFLYENG